MKIVSMKQLREKFHPIRKSLEKGESFLLMYRSKPLGIIRPYQAEKDAEHLLPAGEGKAQLPQPTPLKKLPEPYQIALEASQEKALPSPQTPALPASTPLSQADASVLPSENKQTRWKLNPLDKLGLKKAFV